MPEDTKEQRAEYLAGLLRERAGWARRAGGENDREVQDVLADIDSELARMGHQAKAPAKRAETRPASETEKETR